MGCARDDPLPAAGPLGRGPDGTDLAGAGAENVARGADMAGAEGAEKLGRGAFIIGDGAVIVDRGALITGDDDGLGAVITDRGTLGIDGGATDITEGRETSRPVRGFGWKDRLGADGITALGAVRVFMVAAGADREFTSRPAPDE